MIMGNYIENEKTFSEGRHKHKRPPAQNVISNKSKLLAGAAPGSKNQF
jgi:hypothetical protein